MLCCGFPLLMEIFLGANEKRPISLGIHPNESVVCHTNARILDAQIQNPKERVALAVVVLHRAKLTKLRIRLNRNCRFQSRYNLNFEKITTILEFLMNDRSVQQITILVPTRIVLAEKVERTTLLSFDIHNRTL